MLDKPREGLFKMKIKVKREEERNLVIFEDKPINSHINGKVSSRAS